MMRDDDCKRCLNCGTEGDSASNFCSHCGQSMATSRLTVKSVMYDSLTTILRVDRGFLYTSWILITRPWIVIGDYVRGRRVKYVPAVKMLIILSLFTLLADSVFAVGTSGIISVDYGNIEMRSHWLAALLRFYADSTVAQFLVLTFPASLAVYVVYWRYNSRRYNFAEYFTASVYLCDAMLITQLLLYPFELLYSGLGIAMSVLWCFVLGIMSVTRAFPIKNYVVAAITMLFWTLFTLLLEVLIHLIPFMILTVMFRN